ncbi:RcnB family protein [Sphingobium sp. AN558]|uniref:RcnB family protein n=1 Tax=Sphingobium sp. AN558 TaxID=3133442 RepID=UPI0030C2FE26
MLRKIILAGLMAATAFGGIAPAYAQGRSDGRDGRPDRAQREGGARPEGRWQWQGNRQPAQQIQQQAQHPVDRPVPGRNWQQRNDGEARQRAGTGGAPDRREGQWQQRTGRSAGQEQRQPPVAGGNDDRYLRGNAVDNGQIRRDGNRNDRQDWRRDGRVDNRGGNDGPGVNDGRRWNGDRNNDGRNGGWRNGDARNSGLRNDGRRFDDRTRWSDQRRWDNGWRQDRRYDWSSYRARYGDRFRMGRYDAPRGWSYGYRPVSTGFFLSSLLYSNNYWLDDPYSYRLPPAYGAMRWVRYYDDALLVDTRDGYVVDVIRDFFW